MTVLILERVPASLRGELSRWLIEPRTGVFVGNPSALVREKLWTRVTLHCERQAAVTWGPSPGALLVYRGRCEQGFHIRSCGDPSREIVDLEGICLIRVARAAPDTALPRAEVGEIQVEEPP